MSGRVEGVEKEFVGGNFLATFLMVPMETLAGQLKQLGAMELIGWMLMVNGQQQSLMGEAWRSRIMRR